MTGQIVYGKKSFLGRITVFLLIAVYFQLTFCESLVAQSFQFQYNLKRGSINFTQVKNLIIIPLYINEKGPFNFILDTGVGPTIIIDSTIVSKKTLKNLRSVKIKGAGEGKEIDAYISNEIDAKIGEAIIQNVPTVFLKEDIFNFSNYLGKQIHGLIGFNFFNSFIVKINYVHSRLSFRLPETRKKTNWNKLDLEFLDNRPYVNLDLNVKDLGTVKAKLIVDCGATHALSLEAFENEVFPLPDPHFKANLGVGLSGKINGHIGRISSVKLGDYEIKNVLTSFPDYNDVAAKSSQKQRTGNLGANLLRKFTVIFDYKKNAMYLKKNRHYSELLEHDMSGLEIASIDQQPLRKVVSRVEPDSPAEKAGILADDEILSINFVTTEKYSIDDIEGLFKSYQDRKIVIEISRDKTRYIKLLTLKRRI